LSYAIEIDGMNKTFGSKVAVRDLNLRIPTGSLCGFLGPNGAGKTTTIRVIMSIMFPDSGSVRVLGRASAVESKDRIGYLPEERGVYRKMRVGAFLDYMGRLKGIDARALTPRINAWLEKVGLPEVRKKKCEELSKGMQQKVQFIAAVLHEPELIILDEVFSGLDPLNRRLMRQLIEEQHDAGRTILFSTHAMFEAEALCEHVFMIHRGEKVLDGSIKEIVSRHDPRALLVETADAGGAQIVPSLPGVRSVRTSDERGLGRGQLEVLLEEGFSPYDAIARISAAVPVRRVEIKRVTLEDVFIQVVTSKGAWDGSEQERAALVGSRAGALGASGGAGSLEGGE
jgi:ABC-2 type transport system ATP-binding protein